MARSARRRAQGGTRRQGARRRGGDRSTAVGLGIGAVISVAVLGLIVIGIVSAGGSAEGEEALDFSFSVYQGQETLGGEELALSQVLAGGKPVVLNFWAGLCPPCRAEMPGFQSVYEEFKDEIVLLGVDVGPFTNLGSQQDGIDLVNELEITYPIATVSTGRAVQAYVRAMPTTVFITPDGRIQRSVSGALSRSRMAAFVEELVQASA